VAKDKEPCHNWSHGNGFCKYAEACRFSHDGPKGGQGKAKESGPGKRKGDAVFLATKKGKKARKKLTSLLLKDLKEVGDEKAKDKDNDSDDDDHLFQLIRGVPTVVIKSKSNSCVDYVPVRQKSIHHPDQDHHNRATISAAVSGYNRTPQDKLGGLSPREVIYGTKGMYDSDEEIDEEKDFNDRDGERDYSVEIVDGMRYLQYKGKAGQSNRGDSFEDAYNKRNHKSVSDDEDGHDNKDGFDTHFTVTLMQTSGSSEKDVQDDFVPSRRNEKRATEVFENNDRNIGRVISDSYENKRIKTVTSQIKTETSPEQIKISPEPSAQEWKRRALRAELLLVEMVDERRNAGRVNFVERTGQRARLKANLDMLTANDPPLDPFVDTEYIVIRRLNKGKDWFSTETLWTVTLLMSSSGAKVHSINKCQSENCSGRNTSMIDTSGDELPEERRSRWESRQKIPMMITRLAMMRAEIKAQDMSRSKKMRMMKATELKSTKLRGHLALRRQETTTNQGEIGVGVTAALLIPCFSSQ
jgi:hypothetical protein